MTFLWAWEAIAPGAAASGVCDDIGRARRAASAWIREHEAYTGLVEQVRMAVLGEDLLPCYERTGLALRAKRHSDGRVFFYAVPPAGAGSPLSAREHEVALLAAAGLRSAEVAVRLFVSVRTVDAHLRAAFGKTGTRNRTELANWLRMLFAASSVAPQTGEPCPHVRRRVQAAAAHLVERRAAAPSRPLVEG